MDQIRKQLLFPVEGVSGAGVRIAILDTGIDPDHPDFAGVIDHGVSQSFTSMSTDIVDRCYHGTHIAGIIAGSGAASQQRYRGLAPNASLIVLKTSVRGEGYEADVAAAVEAAIDARVDIINYSAGHSPGSKIGPPPWIWPSIPSLVEEAFQLAIKHGILCVVAAGNDGPDLGSINRPGGLEDVLTVGSVGSDGSVSDQSARGPYRVLDSIRRGGVRRFEPLFDTHAIARQKPSVVAPGENVVAPRARDGALVREIDLIDPRDPSCLYLRTSGTSHATAVVTGLAACTLEVARREKVDLGTDPGAALRGLITYSARPLAVGTTYDYGAGVIKWPILLETLRDFATDPGFRSLVLEGPQLRLINDDDQEAD